MPAPGDILGIIGIVLLAGILFSIISAWYSSTQFNIFTRYTSFAGAKLSGHTTGLGLLGLTLSNLLLVIFSLGILKPVAQARAARFYIERVKITGNVPSAAIAQSTAPLGRGGEGLAQAFDLDAF